METQSIQYILHLQRFPFESGKMSRGVSKMRLCVQVIYDLKNDLPDSVTRLSEELIGILRVFCNCNNDDVVNYVIYGTTVKVNMNHQSRNICSWYVGKYWFMLKKNA